jgi:hypothetical protein
MALPGVAAHLQAARRRASGTPQGPGVVRAHTEEKFAVIARAPMPQVVPLFGADKERVWAPGWDPHFVHPVPASDEEGMVFTAAHSHLRSVWVNTEFDPKAGRIQYVYVIPDAMVTRITLRLMPEGNQTRVQVAYDRTALSEEGDAHVRHMSERDRGSGPDWEKQVNEYLQKGGDESGLSITVVWASGSKFDGTGARLREGVRDGGGIGKISGPPELIQAALDSTKLWEFVPPDRAPLSDTFPCALTVILRTTVPSMCFLRASSG